MKTFLLSAMLLTVGLADAGLVEDRGLLEAARQGDIAGIDYWLKQGANLHAATSNGDSALHIAALSNHEALVQRLLNGGFSPDSVNNLRQTPFTYAAVLPDTPRLGIVELLLNAGADPKYGISLLYAAAEGHRPDVVRLMLSAGANPSMVFGQYRGKTALHAAVQSRNREIVKMLLHAGADVACADNSGNRPILMAKEDRDHPELFKYMLLFLNEQDRGVLRALTLDSDQRAFMTSLFSKFPAQDSLRFRAFKKLILTNQGSIVENIPHALGGQRGGLLDQLGYTGRGHAITGAAAQAEAGQEEAGPA